jgi:hypothetical protein
LVGVGLAEVVGGIADVVIGSEKLGVFFVGVIHAVKVGRRETVEVTD